MQADVIRAHEVRQFTAIVDPHTERVVDVLAVKPHEDGTLSLDTLQRGPLVVDETAYIRLPHTLVATRPYLGMLAMLLLYAAAGLLMLAVLFSSS